MQFPSATFDLAGPLWRSWHPTMYELRPSDQQLWAIVDPHDRQVFRGTLRDCEQWLDRQENLDRRTMPREAPVADGWLRRSFRWIAALFRPRAVPEAPPPAGAAELPAVSGRLAEGARADEPDGLRSRSPRG